MLAILINRKKARAFIKWKCCPAIQTQCLLIRLQSEATAGQGGAPGAMLPSVSGEVILILAASLSEIKSGKPAILNSAATWPKPLRETRLAFNGRSAFRS